MWENNNLSLKFTRPWSWRWLMLAAAEIVKGKCKMVEKGDADSQDKLLVERQSLVTHIMMSSSERSLGSIRVVLEGRKHERHGYGLGAVAMEHRSPNCMLV